MGKEKQVAPEKLKHKLIAIRKHLELSGTELAEKLSDDTVEVRRQYIPFYESGERIPSLIVVWRYAKLVGISMEDLVDDSIKIISVLEKS